MVSQNNGNGMSKPEYAETEFRPQAKRRPRYSAEYKQRIVEEIDQCATQAQKTEILRREGLYATLVSKWRAQYQQHGREGLVARKRGPKPNPEAEELQRLQRENERLRQQLEQARLIVEVQKKVSQLLNGSLESGSDDPK